jgi:hypothetical protein
MDLSTLRAEIFKTQPEFGNLVGAWGNETLLTYYKQTFSPLVPPSKLILDIIEDETGKVLGAKLGAQTRATVAATQWVNTADHHGLLHHPYFYTVALARSEATVRGTNPVTVTLPFGGVSLSNDSFPRGITFHNEHAVLERIFFKSLRDRRLPVYALSPMTRAEFEHERNRVLAHTSLANVKAKLNYFFTTILHDDRCWSMDTFSRQLTAMNATWWRILFGQNRGDFVYLQIDDIANRLLLDHHLTNTTAIHELLFNADWRTLYKYLFRGITGAHSDTAGTELFWYIDMNHCTRRSLVIRDNDLVTREGDITIPLTPERIAIGLERQELMPSTALILLLIHGEETLACAGGSNQLHYLGETMQAWSTLRAHFGAHSNPIPTTTIWCGDNALFAIAATGKRTTELATLFDLYLRSDDAQLLIDEALAHIPLNATIDAILPMLYKIYHHTSTDYTNTIIPTIQL